MNMSGKTRFIMLLSVAAALGITIGCSEQKTDIDAPEKEEQLTLKDRVDNMMVKVEGGTFTMGQTTDGLAPVDAKAESDVADDNSPRPDELPLHKVTVSDFEISRYEVTQGLWKEVMGTTSPSWSVTSFGADDDRAMDGVSWDDAMQFIARLNELTGGGWRLPTEAEWEYAARGGRKSCNYRYSGSNDVSESGWFKEDGLECVSKVGRKIPNELGLYDMSGNAFEWCYDWYAPYSEKEQFNPKGPSDENRYYEYAGKKVSAHVLRGGHWQSSSFGLRVSFRTKIPTTNYKPKAGFRIARGISYEEMNCTDSKENTTDNPGKPVFAPETYTFDGTELPYRRAEINHKEGMVPSVIIYLHGGSAKGSDNESQMQEPAIETIAEYVISNEHSAVFLVPQCPEKDSQGRMMDWVKMDSALEFLIKSEMSSPQVNVYILGGSMGGTGTWNMLSSFPDLFSGAIACAGNPKGCSAANVAKTPVYAVMGSADKIMKPEVVNLQTFLDDVAKAGGMYKFDTEDGWDHETTCTQGYTPKRLAWLFSQCK